MKTHKKVIKMVFLALKKIKNSQYFANWQQKFELILKFHPTKRENAFEN